MDQIFREKLGDFEKTPPAYLWNNIQGGLYERRRSKRIALLKIVGMAAAILLAFLAGWQMTNFSSDDVIRESSIAGHGVINSIIDSSTRQSAKPEDTRSIIAGQVTPNVAVPSHSTVVMHSTPSNLTSIASAAANTSIIGKDSSSTEPKSKEIILIGTEKEFLDKFVTKFEWSRKLINLFASVKKDSVTTPEPNLKNIFTDPVRNIKSNRAVEIAINSPVRNLGRWSLKAEFAPVFNSQSQNAGQRSDLSAITAQNYKPQETTAENTFSGGMIAGYKVSKRLVVKSGIAFNNIRQTTRNIDLAGVNPLYNIPGNSNLASTPAGQVSLSKVASAQLSADINSGFKLNNSTAPLVESELKQDIEFIEIPLHASYKLIDSKIIVGLTGGVSTNILIGNKAVLSGNGERISTGETSNLRSIVYSSAVGLEVGYEITNRISLTVEPRLKHFISSLSTNKSINYKPYQMGIVTGLTYSFN
jgi:hypothetical protein